MTPAELAERGIRINPLVFRDRTFAPWPTFAETPFGTYYLDGAAWLALGDDLHAQFRNGGIAAAEADHIASVCAMLEVV
jgi:hypothetical protein